MFTTHPGADDGIDEVLVRGLLRAQHPDLADRPLTRTAVGWDNEMWRLGDDLVVRLPRTDASGRLTALEGRWLPTIADRLPLPVPVPLREGAPSERFPRPWLVATWVTGSPADRTPIADGAASADRLADFLRALHVEAPPDAPVGNEFATRTGELDRHLAAVRWRLDSPDALLAIWSDATAAPGWGGPPLWRHADLHPANVVAGDGVLGGVIDFGSLSAGDPAIDLAAAWVLLPAGSATRFFARYGDVDDDTLRRARGWAVAVGIMLLSIGQAWERGEPGGQPTWGAGGQAALARVLDDDQAAQTEHDGDPGDRIPH